jgi:hypothetical protein
VNEFVEEGIASSSIDDQIVARGPGAFETILTAASASKTQNAMSEPLRAATPMTPKQSRAH